MIETSDPASERLTTVQGRPWPLEDAEYDVVVVGGGWPAPASRASWRCAACRWRLVEKGDFASATTSQSSKLIHGGLRYLELFDFGLVRESLRERETLRAWRRTWCARCRSWCRSTAIRRAA